MAVVSGRMRPRIPLDRCPANPRPLRGSDQRDAALLCSAAAFPRRGAMRLCGERLGSVGVGVVGSVGWDGTASWTLVALACSDLLVAARRCFDMHGS